MENFKKTPTFLCNGEELSLDQISKKKINSVTINYLSAPKAKKEAGILGFFGKKKIVQEKKELVVNDEKGITLSLGAEGMVASIRFWNQKDWDRVVDYDKGVLSKKFMVTLIAPYVIFFYIKDLKSVRWN